MEDQTLKERHPKALVVLFFTEMWERFSYYGMRALLTLYLIEEVSKGGLGWSSSEAGHLYGIYTGLVYLTPLIGGILADKYLGNRNAIFIGGSLMALGHASLALDSLPTFYMGLLLLILGNGFFKPNISSMVGQLYSKDSPLKDSAYTIFYMGVNTGAFLGGLVCGYLGESERFGWHYGFGAAGIGMCLGLIQFYFGKKLLGNIGIKPSAKNKNEEEAIQQPLTDVEKDRLIVIGVLSFFSILFWVSFEQAGSSMNIYAFNFTDRYLPMFDFTIPASWFQSVNPLFIMILAPLFAWVWQLLAKTRYNPSGSVKFGFGFLFLGLGFVSLVMGASTIPRGASEGSANLIWLVVAYLFHTMGELCLSPVGLSFVSKLSPVRMISMMFGVWLLASAIGNYISGSLSGMIDEFSKNHSLSGFFSMFVILSLIGAVLAFLLSKFLSKKMHGIT
jgi:proton-dependent oligopeptide transporter, POT family